MSEWRSDTLWTHGAGSAVGWHLGTPCTPSVWIAGSRTITCRRLVVIDPEDAEQVERLASLLEPVERPFFRSDFAAALREFAYPPAPIEDDGPTYTDAEARAMRTALERLKRTEGKR